MPYPNSRNDRAWEMFIALVAAMKSAAANRSGGAERSIGRILGPFFLESLAREAYIAADAFEKVYQERALEEQPSGEGNADPTLNVQASARTPEIPPHTEVPEEVVDAFKEAEQSAPRGL